MLTRTNAIKRSVKKWKGIVAGGEEGDIRCGFCHFRMALPASPSCIGWCPMDKPELCCPITGVYQQWCKATGIKKAELAQRMLDGIIKYGAIWIEEGKKGGK